MPLRSSVAARALHSLIVSTQTRNCPTRASAASDGHSDAPPIFYILSLLLNPLPYFLDGQPAAQLAVVEPALPFDLPGESLSLAFELLENLTHAVFGRLDIILALERVAAAQGGLHVAVAIVKRPHELCRRDVLELRVPFGALDLVAVILGGNQFPGADQLVFGRATLGFIPRTGRSDRRERQDCSHSPTWIRRHRFVLQKGSARVMIGGEKTANTQTRVRIHCLFSRSTTSHCTNRRIKVGFGCTTSRLRWRNRSASSRPQRCSYMRYAVTTAPLRFIPASQ